MFTKRADEVFGKIGPFVDVAANLANPPDFLFLGGRRFRFDVVEVILIC
jgi:hypothetical protein